MKTPKAPPVQKAPTRDVAFGAAADAARKIKEQSGVENNIFTSALGDSDYGKQVKRVATLGGNSGAMNGGSPANGGRGSASKGLY